MNKEKSNEILGILKTIIDNPKCELNYNNIFELLIAVILSAQTTDKRVNEVTAILFDRYKTIKDLKEASEIDVEEIIRPLGLSRSKSKNIISVANSIYYDFNSNVPSTIEELTTLKGVGRKTASVVLVEGFKIPAFPVDTHLIRMANRLGYSKSSDPIVVEKAYKKYIDKSEWGISHHLFLLFGRYHCKAISPKCDNCKLKNYCKKKS